jgi:hypothetical protein
MLFFKVFLFKNIKNYFIKNMLVAAEQTQPSKGGDGRV